MNKVGIFDTLVSSLNVGDEIINESCRKQLDSLLTNEQYINLPTRDYLSPFSVRAYNDCDLSFVLGTNILNSDNLFSGAWKLTPLHTLFMKKNGIVPIGVGWSNYQKTPGAYAQWFYKKLLSKDYMISVRDEYTKNQLSMIGVNNVINTSCATMWNLNEEHCSKILKDKKDSVVFTLTDYRVDKSKDYTLIKILKDEYKKVFFWVQGSKDIEYFDSFPSELKENIIIIPPRLSAFDGVLEHNDIDFIGTRLHAGVRALQHARRAIIIGVDNRAIEKNKDFNINVVNREDIHKDLLKEIRNGSKVEIRLPEKSIESWKQQFIK